MMFLDIAQDSLDHMLRNGADKAQCVVCDTEKQELNVETGQIKLLRSTHDISLNMTAFTEGRKGSVLINKCDADAVDRCARQALELAKASAPDEANDISEHQNAATFKRGLDQADLDLMHHRMTEFLEAVDAELPQTTIMTGTVSFTKSDCVLTNSNDVEFCSESGHYDFTVWFTARDGNSVSSFNYSAYSLADLEQPFLQLGTVRTLIEQAQEQTTTRNLSGKFSGDIIITPDCLDFFLYMLCRQLTDGPIISGTSIYKDKLGSRIADSSLSLHSRPIGSEIVSGYDFTADGFRAANSTIIDQGVLKTFLLSLYGANKTGRKRAVNSGNCFVVDPGDSELKDIIASTEHGLLLCRFSGGVPNSKGDFSGVAKNSYYIKDGKIQYPVSETMVSGNLESLIQNVKGISKERVNFGSAILPWISFGDVSISGK